MPVLPEPAAVEQIATGSIIVIHPGSQNLRIGRASDSTPRTIRHVIATRLKTHTGYLKHCDKLLPPEAVKSTEVMQEFEQARLQVSHTLQSCLQSDGSRRYATPPQQISAFNRRSHPEISSAKGGGTERTNVSNDDFVVGDKVMHLSPNANYSVHFPIRLGELNVHCGPGGSLSAVLAHLEIIWKWAIRNELEIDPRTLSEYKVILVIPDLFNRQYLKQLTSLLLVNMGFGACFLIQDHVAATFGAGVGYACVVDVGDQKTSVSCVEDGICHPGTRLRMDFGGGDLTQTFLWLLKKCAFPYRRCNPFNMLDALLLQHLKESFCHVDLNVCGSQEKSFVVKKPGEPTETYTLMVGDECIIAPLSLFTPELLGVNAHKAVHGQNGYSGDPEDPHDAAFIRETSRRKEALESSGGADAGGTQQLDMSVEEDIVVDAMDGGTSAGTSGGPVRDQQDTCFAAEKIMGLDQAVMQSIERCQSDELKRKMYSCILVVGGGMKFKGIGTWLHNRISLQIPFNYRGEVLEIITNPKEIAPELTTWKGAAIMASLETSNELWIKTKEWQDTGVKILRERAPFMW